MHIYLLIDQSGSMSANWSETIGAVNSYVRSLIDNPSLSGLRFNVAAFDADAGLRFTELRRHVSADGWNEITNADATPRGMTPLYDAIGKITEWIEADAPEKATVAVITDGHENSSREVSKKDAKSMMDRLREKGFDVVFLGADFDAFDDAAAVGIGAGQTMTMTAGNYGAATQSLSARTASYGKTGDNTAVWSAEDRKRASGEK